MPLQPLSRPGGGTFNRILAATCLALGSCLALGACSAAPPPAASVVVRDSAGVQIVESGAPLWADGAGWSPGAPAVRIEPEISDSVYLYGVGDVVALADGRLVVANRGTAQLYFFSATGEFQQAVGRRGKGPGEFDPLRRLFACTGDTLVVTELDRLTLFDARGRLLRTERLGRASGEGYHEVEGVSDDCSAVLILNRATIAPPLPAGPYDQRHTLYWQDLASGQRDTVASFAGPEAEVFEYGGVLWPRALPWGSRTAWAVAGDRVVLGDARAFEVEVWDRRGELSRILRWPGERRRVGAGDRALNARLLGEYLNENPGGDVVHPPLDVFSRIPGEIPAYDAIRVDPAGNLWLRDYPTESGGRPGVFEPGEPPAEQVWRVLDDAGRYLGPVRLPGSLQVLGFAGERLVGVERDLDDLERILLFPIRR